MFIKAWPDDNNDDLDDENFKNAQSCTKYQKIPTNLLKKYQVVYKKYITFTVYAVEAC